MVNNKRSLLLDECAFDEITPESAYWVGFLMADGCVTQVSKNGWSLTLSLGVKDKKHVLKFKTFLKSGHKLGVYGKGNGKFASVKVSSKRIAEDLSRFGVVPRKSLIAKVKGGLEFNKDFWRGVVDGDGSIGIYSNSVSVYLCGSEKLMEQFKEFVLSVDPSNKTVVRKIKNKNHFCIKINGPHAIKVLETLYIDAKVYLDRKYKQAADIVENKEKLLSGFRRFTEEQVREIRALGVTKSQRVIAKMYGTGKTTIAHILNNDYYNWVL